MTPSSYARTEVTRLGMAGMARNVGFGVNKVFAADLLSRLTSSQPLIGLLLGMEGLLGLVLNPLSGWISDRLKLSLGRRRLFVLLGLPAGILWIGFVDAKTLPWAVVFLVSFYFFQQVSATPYQAWMPDVVPQAFWGDASGILNLWWQMGNFLAFLPIPLLWKALHGGAFWIAAVLMVGGGAVTGLTVRESPPVGLRPPTAPWLSRDLGKYFAAQFLWWLAFESMASFFTLYMIHSLHGTLIDSALGMALFTLSTILTAVWFGRLYRRRPPRMLLIGCLTGFGAMALLGTVITQVWLGFLLLLIAGVFWGGIQVVSYPWGSDLLHQSLRGADGSHHHGLLYGTANLTQSVGLLVAAPVAGLVIRWQHGSYNAMFWVSVAACAVAVLIVATMPFKLAAGMSSENQEPAGP